MFGRVCSGVDSQLGFEEWLIARAEEESELLVSKLNEEAFEARTSST